MSKLKLPDLPDNTSIWVWYNDNGRVTAYYCIGYYTKTSLVDRVKRDYGYQGTDYDCFHGSIATNQLKPVLTKTGERITYLEVRVR